VLGRQRQSLPCRLHSFCVFSSEQQRQRVLSKHPKSDQAHFRAIEFYPLGRRRDAIVLMIDLPVMNSWRAIKIFAGEKSMRDFLLFRFAATSVPFAPLHG
jgi:adenylate cyclase